MYNKNNYSTKKQKVIYDRQKYYIYYQLADENNKIRIIKCFYDPKKINKQDDIQTINLYDTKFKDYGKIRLKFIEGKPDDKMLKNYLEKFKKWSYYLKINHIYSIDITNDDIIASEKFFFSLCEGYDKLKRITDIEYYYMESCANNAIIYLKKNDIEINCYTYDRKSAYPNILNSDILIPTKPGNEYTLKKFGTIQVGYYRCIIESEHKDFNKIFVKSKNNIYCHLSVIFIIENKDEFNITIKLIKDGEPNAYLYDENDCVELNSITSEWYNKAMELKECNKPDKSGVKNPYVKSIISSAWGILNQRKKIIKSESEIELQNLDVGLSFDYTQNDYQMISTFEKDNETFYKLVDLKNPYKYKLRLKSFVTAQARNDIATFSIKHGLKNVIRIQTDSVSFSKEINNDDINYSIEAKSTGLIHFYNVNKYENLTTGYKSKNFKIDDEDDYEINDDE
jgi:hypothetical protein